MEAKKRIISIPSVKVIAAVAETVHEEIDKLTAAHDQAEIDTPWLDKARQAASDLLGHLNSHLNDPAVTQAPQSPATAPSTASTESAPPTPAPAA